MSSLATRLIVSVIFLLAFAGTLRSAEPVTITEIVASNTSGLQDEDGAFPDWLELFNGGTTNVNLDGWFLTDSPANLTKWRFPAVTANASTATGNVVGSYSAVGNVLGIKVTYAGLSANATGAHIHRAPAGVNGPVIIDFSSLGFTFGARSGTFSKVIPLTPAQAADLLAGNLYVNIHNANFPGGEIRAQLNAPVTSPSIVLQKNDDKVALNSSVSLYPNPSSDHVFLNLGNNNAPVNIELYDIQGRLISALKSSETLLKWDAAALVNGLYFFRVNRGQQVEVHKWLKN